MNGFVGRGFLGRGKWMLIQDGQADKQAEHESGRAGHGPGLSRGKLGGTSYYQG
jgi:hypothetical protein